MLHLVVVVVVVGGVEPSLGAVVAFDLVDVFMKHLKHDTLFFSAKLQKQLDGLRRFRN